MYHPFPAPLLTRLAPTPSGYLHIGNGLSFVMTWLLARAQGGKVLLRIDDLDRQRFRPEYVEDIFRTIEWLGIDFDLGPEGPREFEVHYSQLHRLDLYRQYLNQLQSKQQVYACICSRKRVRKTAINGFLYDGHCRAASHHLDGPGAAWRVRLRERAEVEMMEWGRKDPVLLDLNAGIGDFVVRKKDQFPAYQLASLADDSHWNINFVVRGEDLLWSTAAQLWLARQLGIENFPRSLFWHHELLLDDQGEKLSKSKGASALKTWRESGKSPHEIYLLAARTLGIPEERAESLSTLTQALKDKIDET